MNAQILLLEEIFSFFWPIDKKSYLGKIKADNIRTGKHTIKYEEDGEIEKIDLRLEDYELL